MNFDENVWALCRKVPKGKVTTYKAIAEALGTKAYRRIGQALKRNPDAPRTPCHRVVASDGGALGATIARALIANSTSKLTLGHVRGLGVDPRVADDGRLRAYVPSVFSAEQAAWLTRAVVHAERCPDPVRSLLQLLVARVALRCTPMSI
ncbi:MAG: MGMT family protein, partial [Nanoarchaeota archaeon]|nr:MGMT family protein [Nanoarchaeota archaeon]